MLTRAAEHIATLTLFACANLHLTKVVDHLPWVDVVCACGLAIAMAKLSRLGGKTTIRAALVLMFMRWGSSVVSLALAPDLGIDVKLYIVGAEVLGLCVIAAI